MYLALPESCYAKIPILWSLVLVPRHREKHLHTCAVISLNESINLTLVSTFCGSFKCSQGYSVLYSIIICISVFDTRSAGDHRIVLLNAVVVKTKWPMLLFM